MLCDDLEGWGRLGREGACAYTWLIHFAAQRKLNAHPKATTLQPEATD